MSINTTIDPALLRQWVAAKHGPTDIRNLLIALGHNEASIERHLAAWKKVRSASRQWQGLLYMAAGAMMGMLGWVLNLMNPIPALNGIFLYGCSSVAVVVTCAGLYRVR